MTSDIQIERGIEDAEEILDLLQRSYDDWGDESLFRWKYNQWPGFRPADAIGIRRAGTLVAFRRLYRRRISGTRRSWSAVVLGDTCVAPEQRGQGLYSKLHEITATPTATEDRDLTCTFNRAGSLTHAANLDRGWHERRLPLWINVLNPARAVPALAKEALAENGTAATIFRRLGSRVGLRIGDERIPLSSFVDGSEDHPPSTVEVPVPRWLLPLTLEPFATGSLARTARRRIRLGMETTTSRESHPHPIDSRVVDSPVDSGFVEPYRRLGEAGARVAHGFSREAEDIEHLFTHPHLAGVVVVEDAGAVLGLAPLTITRTGGITRARIQDIAARTDRAVSALLDHATRHARTEGADILSVVHHEDPGSDWVRVDRQRLMWQTHGPDSDPVENDSLDLGFYDVL